MGGQVSTHCAAVCQPCVQQQRVNSGCVHLGLATSWSQHSTSLPAPCPAPLPPVQLPIAMLACARIGAVHSVVFGGFSSDALASRIEDCKARVLITCNGELAVGKMCGLSSSAARQCHTNTAQL